MKHRFFAALTAAVLGLSACAAPQSGALPPRTDQPYGSAEVTRLSLPDRNVVPVLDGEANAGLTAFGVELLLRSRESGENVLVSPFSAAMALSMAANGADGETRAAFEDVLGADVDALNSNAAQLMEEYADLGGSTRIFVANSLWADVSLEFSDAFLSGCAGYDPDVFTARLAESAAREAVNQWVDEKTRGMIPELLKENLDPATVAVLLNAVYLKSTWEKPFESYATRQKSFYLANGSDVRISFMHQTGGFLYFRDEGVTGALLPYDDGRLALAVFLPDNGLDSFLEELDGARLSALTASAVETQITLGLPKFSVQWDGNLSDMLRAMGLEVAFDSERADFSNLGSLGTEADPEICISRVLQSTRLEVDEEGTEAAAATEVELVNSSAPESRESLVLDRPFLYAIWDTQANIPLFLGTFERPT